ncbi:class I SAM-dependent methyltransferase [Paenibacillus arenilitoris]|uniref:Class I SAM-dependent methyltransferase n=1 Tax=Paenibacillus arenilitoris TaxID=2772299 RepID=A0A927CT92_9BACL|nr:class I SAM-dependent methyltransferase [Paenibacillus arenilitoris]MBD2871821.1 class I SAM-dependent methyltransferase [Paenibacillus arenilitoris]
MRGKVEIVRDGRLLAGAAYLFCRENGVRIPGLDKPAADVRLRLAAEGAADEKGRLIDPAFGYACYEYYRQTHAPDYFDKLLLREAEGRRRILDLCCGAGATVKALLGRGPDLIYAVDSDERQIGLLAAIVQASEAARGKVSVHTADAHRLPIGRHAVDYVVCRTALHYLDPQRALAEAYRVLSPGGKLFLLVHGTGYRWHYLVIRNGIFRRKTAAYLLRKLLGRPRGGQPGTGLSAVQARYLTWRELEKSLLAAGFDKISFHTSPRWMVAGRFPVYFAAVAEK